MATKHQPQSPARRKSEVKKIVKWVKSEPNPKKAANQIRKEHALEKSQAAKRKTAYKKQIKALEGKLKKLTGKK